MNILFSGSFDPNAPKKKAGDEHRNRITAKKELWQFFDETIEDILTTYLDERELAVEIINASIWKLHPHYEGPELIREVQLVLRSLKIKQPDNYLKVFRISFERIIMKKIKVQLKHMTRKKSD